MRWYTSKNTCATWWWVMNIIWLFTFHPKFIKSLHISRSDVHAWVVTGDVEAPRSIRFGTVWKILRDHCWNGWLVQMNLWFFTELRHQADLFELKIFIQFSRSKGIFAKLRSQFQLFYYSNWFHFSRLESLFSVPAGEKGKKAPKSRRRVLRHHLPEKMKNAIRT